MYCPKSGEIIQFTTLKPRDNLREVTQKNKKEFLAFFSENKTEQEIIEYLLAFFTTVHQAEFVQNVDIGIPAQNVWEVLWENNPHIVTYGYFCVKCQ